MAAAAFAIVNGLHHGRATTMFDMTALASAILCGVGCQPVARAEEHMSGVHHAIASCRVVAPLAADRRDVVPRLVALGAFDVERRMLRREGSWPQRLPHAGEIQDDGGECNRA
jgi:hypothetical protein